MMKRSQTPSASPSKTVRRRPSQLRSEQTVEVIFEALAQVLDEIGEDAFTTNHIAARAGVSIGTIYQYFDCKEAIVLAMLASERDRMMKKLDETLGNFDANSKQPAYAEPKQILRSFIRHYISAFGTGAPGREALIRLAWRLDGHPLLASSMRDAGERIAIHLQKMQHPQLRSPSPSMSFALTRLLAGTVRAAALEQSPLLGTAAFEDEMVRACWGILAVGDSG